MTSPLIYAPRPAASQLSAAARFGAAAVSAGCLTLLLIAAWLSPNPEGVGSHTALGLGRCEFLYRTGLPCPSCGMTTSFTYFVRGNFLASVYIQPMGAMLALIATMAVWIGFYTAATGQDVLRLMQLIRPRYYFVPLMTLAIAAWAWKIFIHLHGIDGWK